MVPIGFAGAYILTGLCFSLRYSSIMAAGAWRTRLLLIVNLWLGAINLFLEVSLASLTALSKRLVATFGLLADDVP